MNSQSEPAVTRWGLRGGVEARSGNFATPSLTGGRARQVARSRRLIDLRRFQLARVAVQRADAQQNRDRIITAAQLILAGDVDAPLDLVIQAAGVARTTFFRHFPDRKALLAALVEREMDELEVEASRFAGNPNGLHLLLAAKVHRFCAHSHFIDYWMGVDRSDEVVVRAEARARAALDPFVAHAKSMGLCRPDLKAEDIVLCGRMLGGALLSCAPSDRMDIGKRTAELILRGIARYAPGEGE